MVLPQVEEAILEALTVDGMCLPSLLKVAIYSIPLCKHIHGPYFHTGSGQEFQGARAVCNSLGRLVAAGILPSLQQVHS